MIRILTASHFGSKTVHTKRYDFAYMPKREFDAFCDTYDNKDDHVAIVGETLLNEVKYADFPCVTWHCVDERGDVHLRIELSDAIFLESTVNQSYGNMAEPHEPNVYFEVSKKLYGYTVGYIYVGTDEKTGKEQFVIYKKRVLLPLLFMIVFLLMLIVLLRGCISHTPMLIDESGQKSNMTVSLKNAGDNPERIESQTGGSFGTEYYYTTSFPTAETRSGKWSGQIPFRIAIKSK